MACQNGHKEVVSLLLADARIDINQPNDNEATPFDLARSEGHKEVVSLLLADMRIDINQPNIQQCTPLWCASQQGQLPVVQLILASGREVDIKTKSIAGYDLWNNKTAAEIGHDQGTRAQPAWEYDEDCLRKSHHGPLIAALIDSLDADPVTTRQQMRELPELRDPFVSDLFALVVFLCDDLLSVRTESSASSSSSTPHNAARRFFQMAQCLPIELQMVLCNRVFGAGKSLVLTKHSEPAFKKLGKLLASTEYPHHIY